MTLPVVISALGACTPLGGSMRQACANLAAGLSAAMETTWYDRRFEPVTACVFPPGVLPVPVPRAGRPANEALLLAPALAALREVLAGLAPGTGAVPVHLAGPAPQAGLSCDLARLAAAVVAAQPAGMLHVAGTASGRAGALALLADLVPALAASPGRVLVLAVDDQAFPARLWDRQRAMRLRTSVEADAPLVGQGAAAVLLSSVPGDLALARLSGVGRAEDPGRPEGDEPCTGAGLTTAVRCAVGDMGAPIISWYTTYQGERFFVPEFSAVSVRLADRLAAGCAIEHPAAGLGDAGALLGLIGVVATVAGRRFPGLASASGDDGLRAAVLMEAP